MGRDPRWREVLCDMVELVGEELLSQGPNTAGAPEAQKREIAGLSRQEAQGIISFLCVQRGI